VETKSKSKLDKQNFKGKLLCGVLCVVVYSTTAQRKNNCTLTKTNPVFMLKKSSKQLEWFYNHRNSLDPSHSF